MYHILSESTRFCGRYDINIWVCFFSVHSVLVVLLVVVVVVLVLVVDVVMVVVFVVQNYDEFKELMKCVFPRFVC